MLRVVSLIMCAAVLTACQNQFDPQDPAIIAVLDSIADAAREGSAQVDADRVLAMAEG